MTFQWWQILPVMSRLEYSYSELAPLDNVTKYSNLVNSLS